MQKNGMLRTQVLVVGAGPAGATAARFLAQQGMDTMLVERNCFYIKPCGGAIPSAVLREYALPADVVEKEIRKIRIISPQGENLEIALTGGHLCIIQRLSFNSALREIARTAGALFVEAALLHCEQSHNNTVVSILRLKDSPEEITVRSDYVVAADGITGRVASCLNIPKPPSLFTVSAHINFDHNETPALHSNTDNDACEFWFGSKHASHFYSWVFPGLTSASIGTGSRDPKTLTGMFNAFVHRKFNTSLQILQKHHLISKPRAFRIPQWGSKTFHAGNVFFAGDAFGMVLPITYEGIYYAMKSGEFTAQAILEKNPGLYSKLWNSRFRRRFMFMDKIKDLFYRGDEYIERWIRLHRRPEVQELAMRLWLRKETGSSSLLSYVNIFRHLLKS